MTIVLAPSARQISNAASATPPPIPQMSTHSPSRRAAFVTSILNAVSNVSGKAAPSTNERAVVERVELRGCDRLELAAGPVGVLADHRDATVVRDPGIQDDAIAERKALDPGAQADDDSGAVGTQDAGLGDRGETASHPDVQVVQCRLHASRPGPRRQRARGRERPRSGGPRGRRLRGCVSPSRCRILVMTLAELSARAAELGLDVVGAAPAEAVRGHRAAHSRASGPRALR